MFMPVLATSTVMTLAVVNTPAIPASSPETA